MHTYITRTYSGGAVFSCCIHCEVISDEKRRSLLVFIIFTKWLVRKRVYISLEHERDHQHDTEPSDATISRNTGCDNWHNVCWPKKLTRKIYAQFSSCKPGSRAQCFALVEA